MADDPFEDLDIPEDPTEDLDRATEELTVRTEKRRYDKPVTIVEGFQDTDVDSLASELKSAVGAGGTVKDGAIEVQGDHESRIKDLLEERGFRVER